MDEQKEMTARNTSVGADGRQPYTSIPSKSICNNYDFVKTFNEKSFDEYRNEYIKSMNKSFLKTVTMTDLYDAVFESRPPVIDNILYNGAYLFVGAPKVGKSFFMAQLAYHVSTGTPLWGFDVSKGPVLYLALEDDYRRLQQRLYQMFGTESTENLFLSISASQLGKGLDEQLYRFIQEHPGTKLIIIDTLKMVLEGGNENYSYAKDYETILRFKSFAYANDVCILLVHHTRKQQADDKFDMISGTNGMLGAADGAFLLHKEKRTENNAILDISGRDQGDQRMYLKRDVDRLIWNLERVEKDVHKNPPDPLLEALVSHFGEDFREWNGTPSELVSLLGSDLKPNTLTMKLNITAGRLYDEYGIRYENKRTHDGRRVCFLKE